jgi:hypothetical protein
VINEWFMRAFLINGYDYVAIVTEGSLAPNLIYSKDRQLAQSYTGEEIEGK